jgi:hypothetical protein
MGAEVDEMSVVDLRGGECDGYRENVVFDKNGRPEVFYVPSLAALTEIGYIKDKIAKAEAMKVHRRLAYVFKECKTTEDGMAFCYVRCAKEDKTSDPASL